MGDLFRASKDASKERHWNVPVVFLQAAIMD